MNEKSWIDVGVLGSPVGGGSYSIGYGDGITSEEDWPVIGCGDGISLGGTKGI